LRYSDGASPHHRPPRRRQRAVLKSHEHRL
jgi:hypothetical protein